MAPNIINLEHDNDGSLLADGFEKVFIGWFRRCGEPMVAVYDYEKAVDILIERDGMEYEDAVEYMEFNVTGAWMGKGTPAFLVRESLEEFNGMIDEINATDDTK